MLERLYWPFTYDASSNCSEELACQRLVKRANLRQLIQQKLLSLGWFFQVSRQILVNTNLSTKSTRRIKLGYSNLANSAVTDECSKSKNISDYRFVVRLSEHESNEPANSCEEHLDVIVHLVLIHAISVGQFIGHALGYRILSHLRQFATILSTEHFHCSLTINISK